METIPYISVIVPVYNIREWLPRCVRSITAQTFRELELLLVDDGSTDGSGALCEELAREDDRIRVFHKENGGSSSARNLGIAKAKGMYLGFVDSDDYIEPDMYEKLYRAVSFYQAEIAQIGRDEIDEQGRRLPDICVPPEKEERLESEAFLRELLLHRGDCSFCTKLVRRELFDRERFPLGVLNEDFHLLVKLLARPLKIVSLPDQAYHVFYRMGSNTRRTDGESFSRVYADNVDNADMALGLVRREYPRLADVAMRFGIFQRLDYLLHIPISGMRRDNGQYRRSVQWLRRQWLKGIRSPYLDRKSKCYLLLFVIAPGSVRRIHRRLRKKAMEKDRKL